MNKYTILFLSFLIHSVFSYRFAAIHADFTSPDYVGDVTSKVGPLLTDGSLDTISAQYSTPTAPQLAQYDAVIVWSNYAFADPVALGNLLADYVDSGKGVVVAVFGIVTFLPNGYPQGRFANYYVITPGARQYSPALTLEKVIPSHPILVNVSNFNGGTDSFRSSGGLAANSITVATWSNKVPLIVTKEFNSTRRVDLNFYPVSDDIQSGFWDATTDGAEILANSLIWAAQKSTTK